MALHEALRPVTRLWYAYHLAQGARVPRPRGSTSVRIGPEGGRRVLLLGNGPCHGWGVVEHGVGLAGHLAGEVARRTRSATQVDYVGDEIMNIASARSWLRASDLSRMDAAVVVIGVNDAVRLTSERAWRRDYTRLLDDLEERLAPEDPILAAAMQMPSTVPAYPGPLGAVADRHARILNAALRDLVSQRDGVTVTTLADPVGGDDRRFGSPQMYAAWARPLADALVPALGRTRPDVASRAEWPADAAADEPVAVPVPVSDGSWTGLPEAMRRAEHDDLAALSAISAQARERFGVGIATVTLVEGDRARYLGGDGGNMPTSVPLELTHCSHVVDGDRPLIVPNSPKDSRFAGNPMLDLTHVQFYAGHPIRSSTGETIGSFCLMDGFPKREQQIDMKALGEFAARAERELWKLEPAADR